MPDEPLQTTVVAAGAVPSQTSATAPTPGNDPDIVVTVVRPMLAVTIRFINAFLTTLTGLVVAAMASNAAGANVIHATTFWHMVLDCATLSVAGAGVDLLKNLVTIFGKLETKFPLMTGNV